MGNVLAEQSLKMHLGVHFDGMFFCYSFLSVCMVTAHVNEHQKIIFIFGLKNIDRTKKNKFLVHQFSFHQGQLLINIGINWYWT